MTPDNYQQTKEVNVLENQTLIRRLNIVALPIMLIAVPLFLGITYFIGPVTQSVTLNLNLILQLIALMVAFVVMITLHELIHAIFMKLFNKQAKVIFGFKNGMAYAASPGSLYSKGHFAFISLAPFLFLSLLFTLLYSFGMISAYLFIFFASLHAGSCVGDFYWTYLIIKSPKDSLIEDTSVGITFYEKTQKTI